MGALDDDDLVGTYAYERATWYAVDLDVHPVADGDDLALPTSVSA